MRMHTPGPWRFGLDGEEKPFDYEGPGYYGNPSIFGPDGQEVVGCDEYYVFRGPDDARLIAAAPDLLEALKALRAAIGKCTPTEAIAADQAFAAMEQADTAIAKAETAATPARG
jgi:hypothetical protein